jgi:hypothetical protein
MLTIHTGEGWPHGRIIDTAQSVYEVSGCINNGSVNIDCRMSQERNLIRELVWAGLPNGHIVTDRFEDSLPDDISAILPQ